MKKNNYYLLSILPLLISLLIGCASTGINTKNENTKKTGDGNPNEYTEKIDNIKISEFILGIGDTVEISVYRQEDLQRTVKIDLSGGYYTIYDKLILDRPFWEIQRLGDRV